eukprot:g4143.t1
MVGKSGLKKSVSLPVVGRKGPSSKDGTMIHKDWKLLTFAEREKRQNFVENRTLLEQRLMHIEAVMKETQEDLKRKNQEARKKLLGNMAISDETHVPVTIRFESKKIVTKTQRRKQKKTRELPKHLKKGTPAFSFGNKKSKSRKPSAKAEASSSSELGLAHTMWGQSQPSFSVIGGTGPRMASSMKAKQRVGPSASQYNVLEALDTLKPSTGHFSETFAWDPCRDIDWCKEGAAYDIRMRNKADLLRAALKARKEREELRRRLAAQTASRKEYDDIVAIDERCRRIFEQEKGSIMRFRYSTGG